MSEHTPPTPEEAREPESPRPELDPTSPEAIAPVDPAAVAADI
jgi:hypothetical protein